MRFLALAAASLFFVGCAETAPRAPSVSLVPAEALSAVLPDSLGTFENAGEETHRGYFADGSGGGGALGLVTVTRVYQSGGALLSVSASSMDDAARYRAIVVSSGGHVMSDSLVAEHPALGAAVDAGWEAYSVAFGWLLVRPAGRALEVKSMFPDVLAEALGSVDLSRLAGLDAAPVTVDDSFVRAPLAPQPTRAPDESTGATSEPSGVVG